MTGFSIDVELQDTAARMALETLISRMERRTPFLAAIGEHVVGTTKDRFRSQTNPSGAPWTPHAASTIRNRIRNKQTPLTILSSNTKRKFGSTLRGNVSYTASETEARVGSELPYAAIHQLGGTIDKPAGNRWVAGRRFAKKSENPEGRAVAIPAHRITIPARPFLGLSSGDEAAILEEAERWLRG